MMVNNVIPEFPGGLKWEGVGGGGGGLWGENEKFFTSIIFIFFFFWGGGGNYHNLRMRKDKNSLILF